MKEFHRISRKAIAIVLSVGLVFSGIPLLTAPAYAAGDISQQPGVDAAFQLLPKLTNQIINGDFEQGNLNYWDWDGKSDSVGVVKDAGTGSYVGVSERTSSQTAGDWWGLDYKALVTPNGQYYFHPK